MTFASRRVLVFAAILAISTVVYGCSAGSPEAITVGATGTSGAVEKGFIDVQFTATSVIVANHAGMPIKDVYLSIVPTRGSTAYGIRLSTMQSTEKKEIPLADFKTPGGLPWSGKAKAFTATATDVAGDKRNMTLPLS